MRFNKNGYLEPRIKERIYTALTKNFSYPSGCIVAYTTIWDGIKTFSNYKSPEVIIKIISRPITKALKYTSPKNSSARLMNNKLCSARNNNEYF